MTRLLFEPLQIGTLRLPNRIVSLPMYLAYPDPDHEVNDLVLDYYDEMGQRGFRLAADHRLANEHGLRPLFARAAEKFPVMRVALNRVSDTLLFPNVSSPERVMRQVRDEMR